MGKFIDLTGQKFGRLTVIKRAEKINNRIKWLCKCDCGNEKKVNSAELLSGNTKSCGCYQKEQTSKARKTHGLSKTRLYRIWKDMKVRCSYNKNDNFHWYGERNISVCQDWNDFSAFAEWAIKNGYNDFLSIDRIDTNGNYCPDNCRWISQKEQCKNRRNTKFITINGVSHTISEWSSISGVYVKNIYARINRSWKSEDAVFKPTRKINKK